LDYGFNVLKLETVYALVREENVAAKALGRRAGFKRILEYYSDEPGANVVRFVFTKLMYEQKEHLGMGISDVRGREWPTPRMSSKVIGVGSRKSCLGSHQQLFMLLNPLKDFLRAREVGMFAVRL
jgi:hypothetical protein